MSQQSLPSASNPQNTTPKFTYTHHFPRTKFHYLALHPTQPYILLANKHNHLYLYNYAQKDLIHSWSLREVIRQKEEYLNWVRHNLEMNRAAHEATTESIMQHLNDQRVDSIGTEMLRSIFLFDESVARFRIGAKNWSQDISKRLGIKSRVSSMRGGADSSSEYVSNIVPISIVLQTEKRVIMIQYDEISMIRFRLREIKYTDFASKSNIMCMEFLSSHPLIALGCADGAIRFWNYSTGQVDESMTLKGVHQKAIVKVCVLHHNSNATQEDDDTIQFNSFPTMISLSAEGTLVSWNLDKKRPEYTKVKSHDGVSVYDMHVDAAQGIVAVLGYDKSIIVRSLATANELRRIKLDMTKANLNNIYATYSVGGGNTSPAWYLLTAAGSSKIYQISSSLDGDSWTEVPDIRDLGDMTLPKKAKIYNIAVHPVHWDTFFCGTNFGLFIFQLGDKTHIAPPVARSLTLVPKDARNGGTPSSPGLERSTFTLQRSMYHVKDRAIWKRTATKSGPSAAQHMPQQLEYDEPTKLFDLGLDAPVRIQSSYSGKYLSVFWYRNHRLMIYNVDQSSQLQSEQYLSLMYERADVKEICWCDHMDRFALIKTGIPFKELEIHHIESGTTLDAAPSIVPIVANQFTATCGKIRHIFGGRLLGVSYQDRHDFHFIHWDGRKSVGDFLPQPLDVKWCELTQHAILTYEGSYAIFSIKPVFRMQNYVKEKVYESMWWNGSLFILTASDVKCVFVGNEQKGISEAIIASFDIGDIGIKSSANAEEEALDPVPQTRPSGTLALVDVLSDKLFVIDTFGRLHGLSLDHPALKFRMLVCSQRVEQALGWLPYIPVDLHNYLAIFLCDRGYSKTAVSELHQMKPSTKFKLCIQYGHHREAYETLVEEIDVDSASVMLSDESLAKLYMRLAHLAEQNKDVGTASSCLERACQLNYVEAYRSLCVHCAKHGKLDRLRQLQNELQSVFQSGEAGVQTKAYGEILAMARIFSGTVP